MKINSQNCKVLVFFGGPSNERNISLDSARTFYDSIRHLLPKKNINLVFVSKTKCFYHLNPDWIYSNTIEDFEDLFQTQTKKIIQNRKNSSERVGAAGTELSDKELYKLIDDADALFPLIHGAFGEDGELTLMLEKRGRKAILGSSPQVLWESLKKNLSHNRLQKIGFKTCSYILIKHNEWLSSPDKVIDRIRVFFNYQKNSSVVIKPNDCGSSDGVSMVYNQRKIKEAINHAFMFSKEVLVEEKIIGKEFSIILIEDNDLRPLSLFPTEIVLKKSDPEDRFYSRQKKYMPGSGVDHITPANFGEVLVEKIRKESQYIFKHFGFSDWARFDGFLLKDGSIIWSDLNSIPGIGQDGLLFQQSIHLGIDTYNLNCFILHKVLQKEGRIIQDFPVAKQRKQVIGILGGGASSERQVSRMSWCNVIEKLDRLQSYTLKYLFMDKKNRIWSVPRPYTLKHTTEEIEYLIKCSSNNRPLPIYEKVYRRVKKIFPEARRQYFEPTTIPLSDLKQNVDYLFNCLHGGIGENGTIQKKCEQTGLLFNGSGSKVSQLAFDKTQNSQLVNIFGNQGSGCPILLPQRCDIDLKKLKMGVTWDLNRINNWAAKMIKVVQKPQELKKITEFSEYRIFVQEILKGITQQIHGSVPNKWRDGKVIIKPAADGCSTGVILCHDFESQIPIYLLFCFSKYRTFPVTLFQQSPSVRELSNLKNLKEEKYIRLPSSKQGKIILEEFLDTKKGFIEITIGVMGKNGKMISLLPSKTIAELDILSLDEKFNKGVGPNLTPPRELTAKQIESIRRSSADFANRIGLSDYARIDFFYDLNQEALYLIEVNTLPGLTSATILFTQALVTPGVELPPSEFLDKVIRLSNQVSSKNKS